jgi:deoxyribodipyrimidine photo-lyase
MTIGIFIFRRDLRLEDNLGLIELSKKVDQILPIFIFDPQQIKLSEHNKYYFSNNAVQFICECVDDLNLQLKQKKSKLNVFYGKPHTIIGKIIKEIKIDIIGYNKDYSNYAIERDNKIIEVCKENNIEYLINENDLFLMDHKKMMKNDKEAFKVYSSFYKNMIKENINKPIKNNFKNYLNKNMLFTIDKTEYHNFYKYNLDLAEKGGRLNAIKKIKKINIFKEYNDKRDLLSYETTRVSGYLNMGCISTREMWYQIIKKLGSSSILLKQLVWRDYYLCFYIYVPNANSFKKYIDKRFDSIKWRNNKKEWETLINCKTGFLLVDASMNEMKITGFLHNRGRLILGSFWIKYLQIDIYHPEYGSQVGFSKYLLDAIGPSQNKMNHHWLLDIDYGGMRFGKKGTISGRRMDISNEKIKEYDPDCIYIKKWLPHLKDIPNKELYKWKGNNYHPAPMFDHNERYQEWIKLSTI